MYGKKRLLKSMSTKNIDSRHSNSIFSSSGTPRIKYAEIKLTPLSRNDFDMNIINNWIEIRATEAPKRRSFHTSFLYKDYLYIFGGKDISEGKLNDMWKVNLKEAKPKWEEVKPTNEIDFPYIVHHTGNEVNELFYIIGGQNEFTRQVNLVWLFDIEKNTLEKIEQPVDNVIFPPIEMHSCTYNKNKNELIIFGGYSKGELLNTMYSFSLETKTFSKIEYSNQDIIPIPRSSHSALIVDSILYIFGGSAKDGQLLNDLWKFDLNTFMWEKLSPEENEEETVKKDWPKPRSGHSMCYQGNNTMYLFGGKVGNLNEANDLWKYDMLNRKFILLQDVILEQYNKAELQELTRKDAIAAGKKKPFKLLSKKEMEDRKNPFSKNYIGRKGSVPKQLSKSQSTSNIKNRYEKEIFANSGFHSIKYSSIYTLDDKGVHQAIENLNAILPFKIGKNSGDQLSGHLPLPRDGQSMNVYEGNIVIFGGDRNKYPFNDLFLFKV